MSLPDDIAQFLRMRLTMLNLDVAYSERSVQHSCSTESEEHNKMSQYCTFTHGHDNPTG